MLTLTLYFVDGLCGSAKTHVAVRHAHRLTRLGKKVLIFPAFIRPSPKPMFFMRDDLIKMWEQCRRTDK